MLGGINLYQYAPNPLTWVDPLGLLTCGQNSKILSENLRREGRPVGQGEAAGHIVASGGSQGRWSPAAQAREILERYRIGINDAANGIPIGHPNPHGSMHTGVFHQNVLNRLENVVGNMTNQGYGFRAIRSALRRELRAIGREVLQ